MLQNRVMSGRSQIQSRTPAPYHYATKHPSAFVPLLRRSYEANSGPCCAFRTLGEREWEWEEESLYLTKSDLIKQLERNNTSWEDLPISKCQTDT